MRRTSSPATWLHVAQGVRFINYYLLAMGINPPLDAAVHDGNDRLSFTGERHGTAAPIGPKGPASPAMQAVTADLRSPRGAGDVLRLEWDRSAR